MKFKGNGNVVAIALSGLAVVLAATGTAYAVAASQVSIVDATQPANGVAVDTSGRLSTTGPITTITTSGLLYGYQSQDDFITSPTKATLAITKINLSESNANSPASPATELRAVLYKVAVDASGSCASSGYVQLAFYQLSAGDDLVDTFDSPLQVRPTGSAPYCLDLYMYQLASSAPLSYVPSHQLDAYVVKGNYTGIGANSAPAAQPAKNDPRGDHK